MANVRFYTEADKEVWDSYVLNHPNGTLFHLIGWKNVVEKTFSHKSYYLLAEKTEHGDAAAPQHSSLIPSFPHSLVHSGNPGSSIVGVLPLFSVRSFLFGRCLVSLPFAAYGGVLSDNREISVQLREKAKQITQSQCSEYLEIRDRNGGNGDFETKDLYFSFRREIFADLESNMEAIPRKSRRMVRVGEKEGLSFEFGREELIPVFYQIFAKSYHRLGSPVFPIKLFRNLFQEFQEKTNILIVRNRSGNPISGVLTFFYKDEVLPYYAGSLLEYRDLAPNDFMYWQLMKHGWGNGYKVFDFGRSKIDTGSYDFKRHWGFEPEPLPYQYFLNGIKDIPNISPANPKFQRKIELWRKIPFWVTKLLGPRIVKYIP